MSSADKLADWLRARLGADLTHLKLQKLVFYGYGIGVALGNERELGELRFEAWKHGPVNLEVWERFRAHGASPLPSLDVQPESYSATLEAVLSDVVTVYGRLDAWSLRNQTHLEAPWIEAWDSDQREIDGAKLRAYFVAKFAGPVAPPEYLAHAWNFSLDRLPVATFPSFHLLAEAVASSQL